MPPLAPFIFKASFKLSSDENKAKNCAHIDYLDKQGIIDNLSLEPENNLHIQYIGERPRSHGLFNAEGVADVKDTKLILNSHEGVVWRFIVSLREDEAVRINHLEPHHWQNSLRYSMQEVGEKLGIPFSNLDWVAAFHEEEGHPHCHIVLWEKIPERQIGKMSSGEINDIKKIFIRSIYQNERERLNILKNYYRDVLLRENIRDLLDIKKIIRKEHDALKAERKKIYIDAELKDRPGMAPQINMDQKKVLQAKLNSLININSLPDKGRISLAYMSAEVKEEIRGIADWLLEQPDFKKVLDRYLDIQKEFTLEFVRDKTGAIAKVRENAYNDLRDRTAQDVLKYAVNLKNEIKIHESVIENCIIPNDEVISSDSEKTNFYKVENYHNEFVIGNNKITKEEENLEKETKEWFRGSFRFLERHNSVLKYQVLPEVDYEVLSKELIKLRDLIPDEFDGRAVIAYLPEELKQSTRNTANILLNLPQVKEFTNLDNINFIRDRVAENALTHAIRLQEKALPNIKMILHSRRAEEVTEKLINSRPFLIQSDLEELDWTAKKLEEALAKLKVLAKNDREQFIAKWRQKAGLNEETKDVEFNKNGKDNKFNFISKKDWSRLRDNLGYEEHELLNPWMGQIVEEENQKKDIKQEVKNIVPQILDIEKVPDAIKFFENAKGNPEISDDIDELKWTIWTSSWVLEEFGLNEQERFNVITNWANNSNVNISKARIADIIDRPTLVKEDKEKQKNKYFLGKDNWVRLINNFDSIQDTPERPWKPDKEGNLSMDWFRASFRLLERESHYLNHEKRIELPNFESWESGVGQLKGIIPYIPEDFDGRAVMAYLPNELKDKVGEVADWLLSRQDIQQPLKNYFEKLADNNKEYQRIRDRIAEMALQSAIQMQDKEITSINMMLHERRAKEATYRLTISKTDLIKGDENEARWTVNKLHEALFKIGVLEKEEIDKFITKWAIEAELNEEIIREVLSKDYLGEEDLNFIGKSSWNKLRDNLGYQEHELLNPWMGVMEKETDEKTSSKKQAFPKPIFHEEVIPKIVEHLKFTTGNPEISDDIDELKWTIWTSSWVLKEFGLNEQERFNIVRDWIKNSGVNISEARIADIIDRNTLQPEITTNSPKGLGNENWQRFLKNWGVNINIENPWEYQVPLNWADLIWRSFWISLHHEQKKAEYEARVLEAKQEHEKEERKRREGRSR